MFGLNEESDYLYNLDCMRAMYVNVCNTYGVYCFIYEVMSYLSLALGLGRSSGLRMIVPVAFSLVDEPVVYLFQLQTRLLHELRLVVLLQNTSTNYSCLIANEVLFQSFLLN